RGETYTTRHLAFFAGGSVNISRSMAVRKAARVFPEPVGASRRVESPARMGGQPSAWARVGAGNEASNQRLTGSWKWGETGNDSAPLASNEFRRTLRHNDTLRNAQLRPALCIPGMRELRVRCGVRSKVKGRAFLRGNQGRKTDTA